VSARILCVRRGLLYPVGELSGPRIADSNIARPFRNNDRRIKSKIEETSITPQVAGADQRWAAPRTKNYAPDRTKFHDEGTFVARERKLSRLC